MGALARVLAVLVSAGVGVGIGVAVYKFAPFAKPGAEVANADPLRASPSPTSSGAATSSAQANVAPLNDNAAAVAASSSAAPKADEDPAKCLPTLFAEGTFPSPPDLSAVCTETNVMTIAKRVKEAVVKASGGKVSDGMKEWAVLGLHEIAAVAALRGRCCPSAPPLDAPPSPGTCPSVADVLAEIEKTSRSGVPDAEIDATVAHFDSAARCIVRSGDTGQFGGVTALDGGETTMFQKILHRAQGVATHP
jgi:hypothetical protein